MHLHYCVYMSKLYLEVDDDALAAAQAELGTPTKKDTVNEALRIVALRQARVRKILATATDGDNPYLNLGLGTDITDTEIMRQARR